MRIETQTMDTLTEGVNTFLSCTAAHTNLAISSSSEGVLGEPFLQQLLIWCQ